MESQDALENIKREKSVFFRFFFFLLRKIIDGDDGSRKSEYNADNPNENFCGAAYGCTEHIFV